MDEEIKEAVEELEKVEETEAAEPEEVTVEPKTHEEDAGEEEEPVGNIKISVEVVSTIAGIAASEIHGVSCMYTSFVDGVAQRLGAKKNNTKGVRVDMSSTNVSIDLYIVVDYGVKIPELAWEIQENVKNSVESMTGLKVTKVNIHIEGINFDTDKPEETEE